MDRRLRHRVLMLVLALAPGPVFAQSADSLPPGVTPQMVTKGKSLFTGVGLCLACHGPAGQGGIGPNLTDTAWLHGDGSFDSIRSRITTGVEAKESKTGQIMPPKGGSAIGAEDIRAVAAYVWTLSRKPPASGR